MKRYFELLASHPYLLDHQGDMLAIITDQGDIEAWQREMREELKRREEPASWADIGIILDDPYFLVIRDLVKFPNSALRGYSRVVNRADLQGGKGAAILPILGEKLLVLNQFRHPTRSWHIEIPRGYGEPGTTPEENAVKELYEETGGQIMELVKLGEIHPNSGFEATSVTLFCANLMSVGEPNKVEGIESFSLTSAAQFEEWILNGRMTDGFSIAAYTHAKLRGLVPQ